MFSILDIDDVHGDTEARMRQAGEIGVDALPLSIASTLKERGVERVGRVAIVDRGLGAFWEIRGVDGRWIGRVDTSGVFMGLISIEQAREIAVDDFLPDAPIERIELIESDPPSEYRGGRLPVYQVVMDHPKKTHIYIDASTGTIMARRNKAWRTFDFFWMLHTMDYKGRDNFNHPLLTIASLFAIAASSTGILLWGWRVIPKLIRRSKPKKKGLGQT
jgi:uncharacterized membrane protein YkoI